MREPAQHDLALRVPCDRQRQGLCTGTPPDGLRQGDLETLGELAQAKDHNRDGRRSREERPDVPCRARSLRGRRREDVESLRISNLRRRVDLGPAVLAAEVVSFEGLGFRFPQSSSEVAGQEVTLFRACALGPFHAHYLSLFTSLVVSLRSAANCRRARCLRTRTFPVVRPRSRLMSAASISSM